MSSFGMGPDIVHDPREFLTRKKTVERLITFTLSFIAFCCIVSIVDVNGGCIFHLNTTCGFVKMVTAFGWIHCECDRIFFLEFMIETKASSSSYAIGTFPRQVACLTRRRSDAWRSCTRWPFRPCGPYSTFANFVPVFPAGGICTIIRIRTRRILTLALAVPKPL